MEFASFDSLEESNNFTENAGKSDLFKTFTYVGGISKPVNSSVEWFWVESGKQIDYALQFASNEPNSVNMNEQCLCFLMKPTGKFYHDVKCSDGIQGQVLCQSKEIV